ncbi:glycoside hydrolase family 31 protein [Mangrovibacterium diazotrophicum]|uniref:Alpha-glucosidase (Family GH31 glycosyl hydrolase) n=1 Tax=Mangrovibacterium diazotrophicum TaxID=1261403 RepID=A0A419VYH0_9BACT|nr:glycoside hydrolase family 31 protein [Mangrovibacterium diazotrophicum]RKD88287.1 alpha-glucosidase (family GH31 glycosyl hydrolase) [Mangrovibacterium diazotrophicum]
MNQLKLFTLLLFGLFSIQFTSGQPMQGEAEPGAIVSFGNARFTVLTPGLIRMEWSEAKQFEDRPSLVFINRKTEVPPFESDERGDVLRIKTSLLDLTFEKGKGIFSRENLSIKFRNKKTEGEWYPGLGNKGNLQGTTRTLDACDGDLKIVWGDTIPVKLDDGLLSTAGWTLIDDSDKPLFDDSDWAWGVSRDSTDSYCDWYFFAYGRDYKAALKDFTTVAGKIPVPPKYAFGIWWSRYWAYTDLEYRELVREYEMHDLPLDVLVMDMDWHITDQEDWWENGVKVRDQANQKHGWTGYTWEKTYFPQPWVFLDWLEEKGIKTCLNVHPASGVQPHEDVYPVFAEAMGVDPASKNYVPFDIVDKTYAQNYFDLIMHPLEKEGVDFWWLDWQQWGTTKLTGVNPTFYLNYLHYSDMQRQGKRPIIFHRYGGLGNHRYQIGFSGDTFISWKSLAYQPEFTATASNVCFGYWSHDIGGHMQGDKLDPELFTRWIQWGVFSPIFRTHATKDPLIERRMWAYDSEYFEVMREAVKLRHQLFPYLYSQSFEAYESGVSLMRPMYYEYPDQHNAYEFNGQYLFGEDLLVAPITDSIPEGKMYVDKSVWLPEGKWVEWYSGTILDGGKVVERPYLLSEIPLFVREGALIPMIGDSQAINGPIEDISLKIFPGESGRLHLFDDDSSNEDYRIGKLARTEIQSNRSKTQQTVVVAPVGGNYEGMASERKWRLEFQFTYPPVSVRINGKEIAYAAKSETSTWTYDGQQLATIIQTERLPVTDSLKVEIEWPKENAEKLSGFPGEFKRAELAFKQVKKAGGFKFGDTRFMDSELGRLAMTGYRMTLNPNMATIEEELAQFNEGKEKFMKALTSASETKEALAPLVDYFKILQKDNQ